MLTLGFFGEEMTLQIAQGVTFGPHRFAMTDSNGPVDLTGCAIHGHIRSQAGALLHNIEFTITDPEGGLYEFTIESADTATLPCGPTINSPDSLHSWDCRLVDSQGRTIPLYYGTVIVMKRNTSL